MASRLKFFLLLLWLIAASIGAAAPGLAQTSVTTTVGEEKVIVESKQKLELKTPPRKGVARIEPAGQGDAQVNRLIYRPNDASEKFTDELAYALDSGQPQTAKIEVAPRSLGFMEGTASYSAGFKALFVLFVLAVVLESALAILFNWRPFVENFNARAVRPPVSFVVSLVFVRTFSLDLVTSLVNAATTASFPPSDTGKILTALVLAGGSAGVNNLLVALGYRQQRTPEAVAPKPPPTKAWIAVRLQRRKAVGPVTVLMGTPPQASDPPPLVGVISGTSRPGLRYFLADPGRFP